MTAAPNALTIEVINSPADAVSEAIVGAGTHRFAWGKTWVLE